MRTRRVSTLRPRPLSTSLSRFASAVAIAAALTGSSKSADFNWDPLATGTAAGGGPGTWDLTSAFWFNGAADVVWPNLNDSVAIFGGVPGTGLVTIDTALDTGVTANAITFNVSGYTIASALPAETLTFAGTNPTVTVTNGADTATINAVIAGTGFAKAGAGTLVLGGANLYTGPTAINAGVLSISSSANLGDASATNTLSINGGTLRNTGAAVDLGVNRTVAIGASGATFDVTASNALTVSAVVSGTGNFNKIGAGTLNLRGAAASTFTTTGAAGINITGGVLDFQADNQLGNVNNDITINGGRLDFTGAADWDPAATRTVTIGAGGATFGGTRAIRFTDAGQMTGSGTITAAATGATNTIDFNAANTGFTGNLIVNSAVVELRNAQGLGNGTGQTVTVNGGTFSTTVPVAQAMQLNGGVLAFHNVMSGSFRGPLSANGAFTVNTADFYQAFNRGGRIDGVITGTGGMNVIAATSGLAANSPAVGSVVLAGNNTGYSGTITINSAAQVRAVQGATQDALGSGTVALNGGTLGIAPQLTAAGANLGFFGRYSNANAAIISTGVIGGYDFGIQSIAGTRMDSVLNSTGQVPTVFGGPTLNFGAVWTGILNVSGGGTYTFFTNSDDGSALYVDGQPVVFNDASQGVVEKTNAVTLQPGFHSIIVKYGQGTGGGGLGVTYQGPDTTNARVSLGSVANSLTNTGTSLLGSSVMDNNITVSGTTSAIDLAAGNATNSGTLAFGPGSALTVTGQTGLETFTQTGNVTLDGANTLTTGVNQVAGNVANASGGADVVISGNIGQASAGSSLTKAGPRTLTLLGANSFTGGITVSGGTLRGATAALNNNNISVAAGANVTVDQPADGVYSGVISGAGSLTKVGNGLLNLTGANTYTGPTIVNGGILGGTGSITSNVAVNANGGIGGTNQDTFTITGNVGLNSGSSANFLLAAPSLASAIDASGSVSYTGTSVNIVSAAGFGAGTYRLIDYGGTALTPEQFGRMSVNSTPAGFFAGLVNNTANTSIDLIVQAAAATNNWTGSVSGTWDTTTTNWSGGAFANGQQANFPSGAPNRTITGGAVSPQSVTVDTTGGDYSIANDLTGGVIGGLTKNGAGTLTLSGANDIAGKVTVNAGTLSIAIDNAAGTNSGGNGHVTLNGGTLSVTPTAAAAPGLNTSFFNGAAGVSSNRDYSATPVATRIESAANATFTSSLTQLPAPGVGTVNGANVENFGALLTGQFFVSNAGPQTFTVSSDDSTRLFIDGVPVIVNEGGSGGAYNFTNTINLSAGYHEVRLQYNQGTGGGAFRLVTPNGTSLNGLSQTSTIDLGDVLTVSNSSSVNLNGGSFATASIGALKQAGGTTLTVGGQQGKQLYVGSTTVTGAGTVTLANTPDVYAGQVTAGNSNIVKQGNGRLVLDNTSSTAPNLINGTIEVQGGKLVAVTTSVAGSSNPLGNASIILNGGGLFLDSKAGSGTITANLPFANNVSLQTASTIEVLPSAVSTILGSGGNSLSLGSNNLTIDTIGGGSGTLMAGVSQSIGNAAGANLYIASPITGSGNIVKTSTLLNTANTILTNRNPGSLTLTADSPAFSGNIDINAGSVTAVAGTSNSTAVLGTGDININTTNVLSGLMPTTALGTSNNAAFVNGASTGNALVQAASLQLKANGLGSNQTIVFGNDINLAGTGTQASIDVNNSHATNNASNTNNVLRMGSLTVGGSVNRLNVTGANGYTLSFAGAAPLALPAGGFTVAATSANVHFAQNITTAGTLLKLGGGNMRLDGTNTLGALDVRGGTIGLTNQAAVPAGSNFTIANGSAVQLAGAGGSFADNGAPTTNLVTPAITGSWALRMDNSLGVVSNAGGRWGDNVPLDLRASFITQGDTFLITAAPSASVTETVGAMTYAGGVRFGLRNTFAGQTLTVNAPSLTRVGKGTFDFALGGATGLYGPTGTQSGTLGQATANGARLILTTGPARGNNGTATINMVTPTIVNASTQNFVDYSGPNGFVDITYGSTNLNSPGGVVTVNAGATALTGDQSIYALKVTGALTSSAAGTLRTVSILGDQTVGNDGTAGLITSNITTNNADVKLVFGTTAAPREAVILAQGGNATFNGPIVANDLTKMGDSILIMGAAQTRSGSGATLTGLEGVITVNRGGISLRNQNSVGKGGSGAAGSGTTRIVMAGGILETRIDAATTFGAGSSGAAYDIEIAANSTLNPDRITSTNNLTQTFGNLTFSNGADTLNVIGGSGHRLLFSGTNAINLSATTTFNVNDANSNSVSLGGNINAAPMLTTRGQLTDGASSFGLVKIGAGKWQASAGGASMTFEGGTRVEQGSILFEYNPGTSAAGTIKFGDGPITLTGAASFGVFGNAGAGSAVVEFDNDINVTDFGGGFHLINNTTFQTLRYTGQINLAAPLVIGNGGGATQGANPQYGATGSAVISIDQSTLGNRMVSIGTLGQQNTKDLDLNGNIVDGAGSAGNALVLQNQSNTILNINGTGNSYAGGTRIVATENNGSTLGRIDVAAGSKLGTGNVVMDGGFLSLGAMTNIETGRTVRLNAAFGQSAALVFRNLNPSQAQLATIIDPASSNSVIGLSNGTPTTESLNLAGLGDGTLFLGAGITNTTYGGATLGAGAGGVYRLGGGNAVLTIANSTNNILTGTNSLQVGNAMVNGGFGSTAVGLVLNGSNDYSGGTVVDFGSGTFTVANANGLGTGPFTQWSGNTVLSAVQSIPTPLIYGGTLTSNVQGAIPSGAVNIGAGSGLAVGPALVFGGVEQTFGHVNLLGNATIRANTATILNEGIDFAQPNLNLNVNGQGVLVLTEAATGPGVASSGTILLANANLRSVQTALAISNFNQIGGGNINLNGGVLILDNTGLSGRTIGGTGANQIQITTAQINGVGTNGAGAFNGSFFVGGGFAARGTALTIGNSDVVNSAAFDNNFTLGSSARINGQLYANKSVTLDVDTVITARRTVTIGRTGPGFTQSNDASGVVINNISGDFSGAGSLVFHSNTSTNTASDPIAEVVLSGALAYTGSPTDDTDGGGAQRWISAGPGGLIVTTGPSNPAENGDIFVRFSGQNSLPSGNGGNPAYIIANRYAGNAVGAFRTGVLVTGDGDGETYRLNNGYKLLLNGVNGTGSPLGATFGSTGGDATLRDSQIGLMAGVQGQTTVASSTAILVRDGTLTLGTSGATPDGAVRFQPANYNIANSDNADPGATSAGTGLIDNTGAKTLITRGAGTTVLGNVAYRTVADSGDTSAQFTWQLGGGTAGVAEGFVRETSDTDNTKNLSNVKVTMSGGVLEFASAPRAITLGTGVGQINMAGTGGGGFAAVGAKRSVSINGNAALTWGTTANFVGATQPLILGSPKANNTLEVTNAIDLGAASRSVATIRGTGTVAEGEISGAISGTAASQLRITSVNRPDGSAYDAGSVILSGDSQATFTGSTAVQEGALLVTGNIGGSAVTVDSGATVGGSGTVGSIVANGNVAPGLSAGVLTTLGDLTLNVGATLSIEINVPGTAGVGYDQVSVGGLVSLGGSALGVSGSFNGGGTQDIFTIILNSGEAVSGEFAGLANASTFFALNGQQYRISYFDDVSTPAVLETSAIGGGTSVSIQAVPEPSAAAAIFAAVGALAGLRRFRRRSASV